MCVYVYISLGLTRILFFLYNMVYVKLCWRLLRDHDDVYAYRGTRSKMRSRGQSANFDEWPMVKAAEMRVDFCFCAA